MSSRWLGKKVAEIRENEGYRVANFSDAIRDSEHFFLASTNW